MFSEPTGRRWQRVRLGAIVLSAASTLIVVGLIAAALLPPSLPATNAFRSGARPAASATSAEAERRRIAARERLRRSLTPPKTPTRPNPSAPRPRANIGLPGDSLLAAFYVNWDDNSLAALKAHADHLDWVIAEWGFIAPGGDSLKVSVDTNALDFIEKIPAERRPSVLLMVTNVTEGVGRFGGARGVKLLGDSIRRRTAAKKLASEVKRFGLAGVTVDFEEVPEGRAQDDLEHFLDELRVALGPGLLLTQAIGLEFSQERVARFAAKCDRMILMLYDEHDGKRNDPGPVASRDWYIAKAQHLLEAIPVAKAIAAIGAFGYDWNDAGGRDTASVMTAQEVWRAAALNGVRPGFDSVSRNPYLLWTDADSIDHFAWYLDAVSGADEVRASRVLGITAHAVWRLGGEDPALWRVLGRHGELLSTDSLRLMDPGYDVRFDGRGELLRVSTRPRPGFRRITTDSGGEIHDVDVDSVPSPWVVARTGEQEHKVALTFDDGPDPRWTPQILDTLRSRGATATFFMIGNEVEVHPRLARRILAEGNEIGNHTFTHPNLATTSRWMTRLQIVVTSRLLEAVLDRQTLLFRPPYFGDADPTTPDELVPIAIASELGYLSVGTRVDGDDWKAGITADSIIRNVLNKRPRGNVVLLHDGGGNREQTIAMLGRLIDSLRARGDTIVSLGALAGLTMADVMPPISGQGSLTRMLELLVFGGISVVSWLTYRIFFVAIILGLGRLSVILGLAAIQRFRQRPEPPEFAPSVSVVVPAFNEQAVIVQTVESLLEQVYAGPLEIVVVDDGSPDDTLGVLQRAFGANPKVRILTKPNGGKASALNFGIAQSVGDIIIGLDADTLFEPDTVRHLVAPLADPRVGAVAGNAKVGNRINLVTRWQALEYVTSQNLDRRAFALLDCITVVPGAIGAFRKTYVAEAGGFSNDTLAEDQDLTLAIGRRGHQVAYADQAIAWTEAPDTLRSLAKQRFRWAFGTMQCAWKHRDLMFRRSAGTLGFVALPNVWIFQLFYSAIAPIADLVFVGSLIGVFLTRRAHGDTYQIVALGQLIGWYAVFLVVDWLAAMIAFFMEPGEDRRLTWLVFLQRFGYRQVMYWVVVKSVIAALRGGLVGWGKLDRKATVGLRRPKDRRRSWWKIWRMKGASPSA